MLTLVVPGLIWPRQTLADLAGDLPLPALSRLLGCGHRHALPPVDATELAALALGGETPLPAAALRELALTGKPATEDLLCLDPVSLGFAERNLVLDDPTLLELGESEAAALAASLAPCFAELGEIDVIRPTQWTLRLRRPAPAFPALPQAVGRALSPLPADPVYAPWRHALNEAQMTLHIHPVNRARDAAGKATVNSLWPWGAGRLPRSSRTQFDRLVVADPVLRGLAALNGIAVAEPSAVLATASARNSLVLLETLDMPFRRGDGLAWRDALLAFERDWAAPVLQSLRRGKLNGLRLIASGEHGGVELHLGRLDLWKPWRRPVAPVRAFAEVAGA